MRSTPLTSARLRFDNEGTPVSRDFDDVYFSRHDGLAESRHVFLQGNQLADRFNHHPRPLFIVAETGFGTGLNFLALWQLFDQFRSQHPSACLQRLHVISIEKYPLTAADLQRAHLAWPELAAWATQLQQQWPQALPGCHRLLFADGKITLDLWFADVNQALCQPDPSLYQQVDAWFLDGFAPAKNPDMWSGPLFQAMAKLTRGGGTVATFSAAGVVRRGLQQAGFIVRKHKGFAHKRHMISALLPQAINSVHPQPWYQRLAASQCQSVAIIGGGIASVLLALALLRRGMQVTLYCADSAAAQGASGNRQGAVYPLLSQHNPTLSGFFLAAFTFARRYYDALPVAVDHDWCGVTQLAFDSKSQKKISNMLETGVPATLARALDAPQASVACGLPLHHPAVEYPAGGWINPAQLTSELLALAEQQGLHVRWRHQAVRLDYCPQDNYQQPETREHEQHQGWRVTFASGQTQWHPLLVLANGWQVSQFAQTADLPVTPVAGQVSHIPATPTLARLRQVLCYDGYLTPQNPRDGLHCLGASYRHRQTDASYHERDQQENRQRLLDCLPQAPWTQQADISAGLARSAVRCVIRDHLPLTGNAPDYPATLARYARLAEQAAQPEQVPVAPYHRDLFILAALGSRGLCSAPLAAEILAAQICGEPQPVDTAILNALNPNRLWIRKLLRGREIKQPQSTEN